MIAYRFTPAKSWRYGFNFRTVSRIWPVQRSGYGQDWRVRERRCNGVASSVSGHDGQMALVPAEAANALVGESRAAAMDAALE